MLADGGEAEGFVEGDTPCAFAGDASAVHAMTIIDARKSATRPRDRSPNEPGAADAFEEVRKIRCIAVVPMVVRWEFFTAFQSEDRRSEADPVLSQRCRQTG